MLITGDSGNRYGYISGRKTASSCTHAREPRHHFEIRQIKGKCLMDWIAMKGVAEYVTEVLDTVLKRGAATQEQIKKAVAELQTSVLETLQYVSCLEGGKPPDRQAEVHLVSLWKAAAGAFYGIDGALAERATAESRVLDEPRIVDRSRSARSWHRA